MSRMKKTYPPDFKAEAVRLVREDGMGGDSHAAFDASREVKACAPKPQGDHRFPAPHARLVDAEQRDPARAHGVIHGDALVDVGVDAAAVARPPEAPGGRSEV